MSTEGRKDPLIGLIELMGEDRSEADAANAVVNTLVQLGAFRPDNSDRGLNARALGVYALVAAHSANKKVEGLLDVGTALTRTRRIGDRI